MRAHILLPVLALLAATVAWPQCRVIDDFKTGETEIQLRVTGPGGPKIDTKTGSMIGGFRYIAFSTALNPFLQLGEVKVERDGVLTVSNGVREIFRIEVYWGIDANGNVVPLGYFPTGCDRIRVTFDSNSAIVNFNFQVYTPLAGFDNGINLDGAPDGVPFCVDFPFSSFVTNTPDVTPDFASQGIDHMDMVLQSGPLIGANNFAITKIETVDSATAAANACAFVAERLPLQLVRPLPAAVAAGTTYR